VKKDLKEIFQSLVMYDTIIIGGGVAGLVAALNAGRRKLTTLLIEGSIVGGQITWTNQIEDYPGIDSTDGFALGQKIQQQAEKLGVEIRQETATDVKKISEGFEIRTSKGVYESRTIILATGAQAKKLGVEGETEFLNKGLAYCATCDGPLFKDKVVAVVGGGDSAARAVLFLINYVKRVYLIHRRKEMRAEAVLVERMLSSKKLEPIWDTVVEAVLGDKIVRKLRLKNLKTEDVTELPVEGVFVEIGHSPETALAEKLGVKLDRGFVKTDKNGRTNVPGVFAAGDLTNSPLKKIVTASAEGSLAAFSAANYLGKG